jgi:GH43 family beta-xylosidase
MKKPSSALVVLALIALSPQGAVGQTPAPATRATFTNPVVKSGADPWVVRRDGVYYFIQSRGRSLWVSKAKRLTEIGRGPWACVWAPPRGTPYSEDLWAPELHYLRGRWYVYVAADDGENRNHRMYVLEGTSQDPQAPFVFRGKLATIPDRWAIDGTVVQLPGDRLYFLWSGWEGTDNVAQNLYIAPMSDPLTISGERVRISRPEYDWERRGEPHVGEGPGMLAHDGKVFIIYSASGSWTDDYCVGMITWTGGDPLDPGSWVKTPRPVFSKTAEVFGPGHASFTTSPDGREDWIVYHAAKHKGAGWNRDVRMQRFTWNPDGSPRFGEPVAPGVPLAVPSGDALEPAPDRHAAPPRASKAPPAQRASGGTGGLPTRVRGKRPLVGKPPVPPDRRLALTKVGIILQFWLKSVGSDLAPAGGAGRKAG